MPDKKKTLLLVDDDQSQLAVRKVVLEISGYEVLTADDALRGMQLFLSHAPDAVVLDYEMPTNGEVLAGRMRSARESVPIVMLSGCVSLPNSALDAVDKFVAKDTPPSFLIAAIENVTQHALEASK